MKNRALILGGYGNFGRLISQALVAHSIPITIAGRNPTKMQQFKAELLKNNQSLSADIETAVIDANKNIGSYLASNKPKMVVNTCGPFQPIQETNFRIIEACIEKGVNYVDLADGRDFVREIVKFDQKAKQANVTAITGASTAPGLSSALLEQFLPEFKTVESVYYGFSPGQKSTRGGQATARGVMSYVGKQMTPYGVGFKPKFGWQDLYAQYYPGVGYRLMGNIDHPDLDLFPKKYPLKNLNFHAGVESKLLHLTIWVASWLIRLGVPLNLVNRSGQLLNISHYMFDWMGSDVGVMHMKIRGTRTDGGRLEKIWYLVARDGHGPNVATVPAILLAKRICEDRLALPGVHPCVGLVSLQDYLAELKKFNILTFTQEHFQS